MIIAIDFDGTCVTHEFPKVGINIGAAPVLKELVENGHQLILFTMRSDVVNPTGDGNELHLESGDYLTEALEWFKENDIELYGIQTNPTQHTWTTSPKAYAQLYIDDAALGCPLTQDDIRFDEVNWFYRPGMSPKQADGFYYYKVGRPYVDWVKVREYLVNEKLIK